MINAKQKYRLFLQSPFWKELSERKKAGVKKCEDCGKKAEWYEAHHVRYPENWFDTKLEDLVVLCRECHRKQHGFTSQKKRRFFPYRDDQRFNEYIHRLHYLRQMIASGRGLRERDRRFLKQARRDYPKTKKDAAMVFHVRQVLEYQKWLEEGVFTHEQ